MRGGPFMAVALIGVASAFGAQAGEPRKLLATQVDWVDSANDTGRMLFQGTIDSAGNLDGEAYPGDGSTLVVTGSVSGTGGVSGSLDMPDDVHVGTFTGQLNGQQELEGDLVIDGDVDAEWTAPADELPSP